MSLWSRLFGSPETEKLLAASVKTVRRAADMDFAEKCNKNRVTLDGIEQNQRLKTALDEMISRMTGEGDADSEK